MKHDLHFSVWPINIVTDAALIHQAAAGTSTFDKILPLHAPERHVFLMPTNIVENIHEVIRRKCPSFPPGSGRTWTHSELTPGLWAFLLGTKVYPGNSVCETPSPLAGGPGIFPSPKYEGICGN